MGNPRIARVALLLVVVSVSSCASTSHAAGAALDIRGSWDMVAVADNVQYPQTMHVTNEDTSSGKWSGDDVGAGLTFTVTGTLTGNDFASVTTGNGYTSNAKGKIRQSGSSWTMSGTFTDSNQRSGTFTAKRVS
jgi:hypothetical protein